MTILVRSGESFIGADLRGIQIPGADVSHGIFEYAQLQGADLRKVNLRKCWLRSANLSGVKMTGVQFGECPFLGTNGEAYRGSYSPDGKTLAAVIGDESNNYSIIMYDTSTWEKLLVLEDNVTGDRLLYSPDSRHIASWGNDQAAVLIWDAASGVLVHRSMGHTSSVSCVAYSPSRNDFVSASEDGSVRVWDTQTGILKFMLEGHAGSLSSVAYSSDGKQIATGGEDKILRLWDATSRQQLVLLVHHTDRIEQIEYSPNGQEIITRCYEDSYLHVWDFESGQKKFSLEHNNYVKGVQYSPDGKFAASFYWNAIYQWDMQTFALRRLFDCLRRLLGMVFQSGSSGATLRFGPSEWIFGLLWNKLENGLRPKGAFLNLLFIIVHECSQCLILLMEVSSDVGDLPQALAL
ncbi:hypothetical protein BX616_000388 [Lobosporangium transversale]|nr:hypothetical protein BX616_000388 [Lobosporangium transversale]